MALACSRGWTKARVGHWLGISRARVGQKVDKLLHYATSRDDVPVLTELMVKATKTKARRTDNDKLVAFTRSDWDDLEMARSLLEKVV